MTRKFTVGFFIRTKKGRQLDANVPVWVRIRIGKPDYADIQISTGLSIPLRHWDAKREAPKCYSGENVSLAKYLSRIDGKLSRLEYELRYTIATHEDFKKGMAEETIRKIVDEDVVKSNGIPSEILGYCDMFIRQISDGSRLYTDKTGKVSRYEQATIKSWKVTRNVIADSPIAKIVWERATKSDMEDFVAYVLASGCLQSTCNKHITNLKALAGYALDDGLLKDPSICRGLKKVSEAAAGAKTTKIFLTSAEIEALYAMHLEPGSLREKVRDVFCMGCFLGQRFSDYGAITPDMFTTLPNGIRAIRIKQKKTGKVVNLPFTLSPHIEELAGKYSCSMPAVADQVLNRYIKDLCKQLADSVPTLATTVPTTLISRDKKAEAEKGAKWEKDRDGLSLVPRWNLVVSHTARRSCITNLYIEGYSEDEIMIISGHTTRENLHKYILEGDISKAERLAEKLAQRNSIL